MVLNQGVDGHQVPEKRVENIVFSNKGRMNNGIIKIWVNNYSGRNISVPFEIEVEMEGDISTFVSGTSNSKTFEVGEIKVNTGSFDLNFNSTMTLKNSQSISKSIFSSPLFRYSNFPIAVMFIFIFLSFLNCF